MYDVRCKMYDVRCKMYDVKCIINNEGKYEEDLEARVRHRRDRADRTHHKPDGIELYALMSENNE